MGITSTSQAIQCLGGYGYSSEFPVEQYMRDVRIHPIHEGTTGIQGMDLLGRKVTMKKGAAVKIFLEEIQKGIDEASGISGLESSASDLANAAALWRDTTYSLLGIAAKGEIDLFLADATLYLELSGIICIAWQWLLQGIALSKSDSADNSDSDKNFSKGKMFTLNYFYQYELPKIHGLTLRLKNADGLTLNMKPEFFED